MKYLSGQKNMLLSTIVLVKASLAYDLNRPIQRWYDNAISPGSGAPKVIYHFLVVDDQGNVAITPDILDAKIAAAANIPPEGAMKNTRGEIYPPVYPSIDVSKVGYSPISIEATWRPEPQLSDSQLLLSMNSKLDKLLEKSASQGSLPGSGPDSGQDQQQQIVRL